MNDIQAQFDRFCGKLQNVKQAPGGEWRADCPLPSCEDTGQHLYIRVSGDKILVHCQHGRECDPEAIVKAVGLEWSDLYADGGTQQKPSRKQRQQIAAVYNYTDAEGTVLHQTVRYGPIKTFKQRRPNDQGGWTWSLKDSKTVLYHLPEVIAARPDQVVVVCEGEKTADAIRGLSLIATCNPMGAGKWEDSYTETLKGKNVIILPDNDTAGLKHVQRVAQELYGQAEQVRVLLLPGLEYRDQGGDDPADWLERGGDLPAFLDLVNDTPFFGPGGATWADLDQVIGPIEWEWKGWLPRGLLTILAGEPGAGKSALALCLAGCFLRGDPWPDGSEYTGELGAVLWCEAEAAQAINLERAKAWKLPLDRLLTPFENPLQDVQLDDPEHLAAVSALAKRPDVRLVIVDSLRGAHSRDENSSESIFLVKWLAQLARDTGKTIILTHHLRKRGLLDSDQRVNLERLRGSSAIVQTARLVWAVDAPDPNDEALKRLSVIKNNLARFSEPLGLRVDEKGVTFSDAPTPPKVVTILDQAIEALKTLLDSGPLSYTDLAAGLEGLGISEPTARRAKKHLGIVSLKGADGWSWSLPYNEYKKNKEN